MNTIRDAILQAAAYIEQHPKQFDFMSVEIPDCGTPGCALGWIGYFMGMPTGLVIFDVSENLGTQSGIFYDRMTELSGDTEDWMDNATDCAACLRLYADRYHSDEDYIPASVRELFNVGVTA